MFTPWAQWNQANPQLNYYQPMPWMGSQPLPTMPATQNPPNNQPPEPAEPPPDPDWKPPLPPEPPPETETVSFS